MPSLDQPPQLPAPLLQEVPPSVPNLIAQVDPWVIYQLKKTILSEVHYENQLYGTINSLHGSIFPLRRRFMIIPQAIVRRAMDADEVDEDLGNVSFGSTGALHESRHLPGHEAEKHIPDFVTVKVIPQLGDVREHYIVCVVEVKREYQTRGEAQAKMRDYMKQIAEHGSRTENLRGYLVMANEVIPWRLERRGFGWAAVQGELFDMFALGDRFTRELCDIARRNWNNPA